MIRPECLEENMVFFEEVIAEGNAKRDRGLYMYGLCGKEVLDWLLNYSNLSFPEYLELKSMGVVPWN